MKKNLLLITLVFAGIFGYSQTAIPNGNFESWTNTPYENPLYYFTNNLDMFGDGLSAGVTKTTDAYHGDFALKLTSMSNESLSMAGNYNPNNPPPWTGGIPISGTPTGFRGYYKYDIQTGDTALMLVNFSKNGVNIGVYITKIFGSQPDYTLFNIPLDPPLPIAPDSVILFFISSDALNEIAMEGSTITIDSISFTGIATQPAMLNGDFELWETNEILSLDSWHHEGNDENPIQRSTDAAEGMYATELITYLDEWDSGPRATPQRISTTYYDNYCDCMAGGYPYSQQVDTIAFWYKYSSENEDTANIRISFKNNGSYFFDLWQNLIIASDFQYVEIPFNLPNVPDSVGIEIMSSSWNDSLLASVGSTLIIDELQFKSQPLTTGIRSFVNKSEVSLFPNPNNGRFTVVSDKIISKMEVINLIGEKVYSESKISANKINIDLTYLPKGVYLYQINGEKLILKTGKLVID
ncbi:MAG: T9SS type A sorting domain-containing protein [Bacteroidales bacterium]|nr:T9SS type A sorting domain-containing protein [Bacteroidales bacterium]